MKYRMERQQLRHDENMAKRQVAERDRIDQIFKVVYDAEKQAEPTLTPAAEIEHQPAVPATNNELQRTLERKSDLTKFAEE